MTHPIRRDLMCDPKSLAGAVDQRVVAEIGRRYPLDPDYLACMDLCHGGVPKLGVVRIGSKRTSIARFLTLVDEKSPLPAPFRPHFDNSSLDERIVNGISFLKDYEHATSRALFSNLLPFATTLDDMCLDRAYVDLFCFDFRKDRKKPAVVLWVADLANDAFMDWEQLPFEERFDEEDSFLSVPWETFVTPIADSFADFVTMLQPVE